MELKKKAFYYIRHGETDWNLQRRVMGQINIPLNQNGITQAREARESLVGLGIQTIAYSPLNRAKMTAEIINEVLNVEMVPIEDLKEFSLGKYETCVFGEWFNEWERGGILEGAETHQSFLERALRGINEALSLPGPVLIVGHGGAFWAIEHYAKILKNYDLPNCKPLYFTPNPWKAKMLFDFGDEA